MYKKYILALLAIIALTVSGAGVPVHAEEGSGEQPQPGLFEIRNRAQNARGALEERHDRMEDEVNSEDTEDLRPLGRPFRMGSTTSEELRDRFEKVRANFFEAREHFASTTALRKAQFTEEARGRILERAEHIASLTHAMVGRLTLILERLEARITELKAAGVDVSAAESAFSEAEEKVADATAAVEAVKEAMKAALDSETPRDEIQETVKPLCEKAKQALRQAYEALRAVAQALPHKAPESVEDTNS